jgi:hypothetical protein
LLDSGLKSTLTVCPSVLSNLCLKGVFLAKKQNLSNQLDSLKDTNSRLIDYVKSINKKVGTANSEKEFSEITENPTFLFIDFT